jgi:FAD synthetase
MKNFLRKFFITRQAHNMMYKTRDMKRSKVLVFGTFDIFHKGHESFLRQAKKHGGFLTVVVARDKTVKAVKERLPKNKEKVRLEKIKASGMADASMLGYLGDKYRIIKKINPDVICLGYDQSAYVDKLAEKLLAFRMKNVRIKRLKAYQPKKYKSSLIDKSCNK